MSRYQAYHKPLKRQPDPMMALPLVLLIGVLLSVI
jgi:hypothetical protein